MAKSLLQNSAKRNRKGSDPPVAELTSCIALVYNTAKFLARDTLKILYGKTIIAETWQNDIVKVSKLFVAESAPCVSFARATAPPRNCGPNQLA
jgi:hypothetical protein